MTLFLVVPGMVESYAASYVVNNTGTAAGTVGTFAWAIAQANATVGPHTITFDNVLDGQALHLGGAFTTSLTRADVTIDGTTMAGYSCGNPRVLLSCDAFNGWQWTASGCTIKGVRIRGGLQLNGTGGHRVLSCVFNIDFTGTVLSSAAKANIRFNAGTSTNNIIGGLSNCERNVMAGIGANCIVWDASGGGDQVLGNYMGSDITGLGVLGTGFTARVIWITAGSNHIIDGNTLGNVVGTGNGQGIYIQGGTGHNIRNNNIGALQNRLFATGFGFPGAMAVYFDASSGNNSTLTNNVIGNCTALTTAGIVGCVVVVEGSTNITLRNNYIGCDINFNNGGSSWAGVYFYSGATSCTLDGNYIGHNGILSGQRSHGIALFNCPGTTTITNNYIGVTPTGGNMGNGDAGIEVNTGVNNVIITGNYIGFNKCMRQTNPGTLSSESGGIRIISGQTVTISGNYIGTLPGGRLDCGNIRMGIGIEGATATKIDILNNVIAYNKLNAIQTYKDSPDKILISQNCIFCNTFEGIELSITGGTTGAGNTSYGRTFATTSDGARATSINAAGSYPAWESDFSGATWILRGFAPAGSTVEVFQNHHCNCDATSAFGTTASSGGRMQGIDYIASVVTGASGRWTYSLPANTVKNGFTVTASDLTARRTSEFSPCVSVTTTCLPPLTTTASGSGTGISGAISGTPIAPCATTTFTTSGSSTFIRTSCYNNTFYTWLKNGVVVYGPSLIYLDYSVISAADPTDDGNYVLRVEDGNAAIPACYLQSSPVVVDVVDCALKIDILSFSGWATDEANKLTWSIDTDEHQTIELQSSTDGINFYTIYSKSIHQSIQESFDDYTDLKRSYYRLQITPNDGKLKYSTIIVIDRNVDFKINLMENVVNDLLNVEITSNSAQKINYVIYDVRGIIISSSSFQVNAGLSKQQITLSQLSSAMYLIKFEPLKSGKIVTKRFIR